MEFLGARQELHLSRWEDHKKLHFIPSLYPTRENLVYSPSDSDRESYSRMGAKTIMQQFKACLLVGLCLSGGAVRHPAKSTVDLGKFYFGYEV